MFHVFLDSLTKKRHYFDPKAVTHLVADPRSNGGGVNVTIHFSGHSIPSLLMSDEELEELLISIDPATFAPPPP
jgi:hypothetical protein